MKNKNNNICCPDCESESATKYGYGWRARQVVQRYRCRNCGRTFTPLNGENKSGATRQVRGPQMAPVKGTVNAHSTA